MTGRVASRFGIKKSRPVASPIRPLPDDGYGMSGTPDERKTSDRVRPVRSATERTLRYSSSVSRTRIVRRRNRASGNRGRPLRRFLSVIISPIRSEYRRDVSRNIVVCR